MKLTLNHIITHNWVYPST